MRKNYLCRMYKISFFYKKCAIEFNHNLHSWNFKVLKILTFIKEGVHKLRKQSIRGGSPNAYTCLRGEEGGHWLAYVSRFTKHYFKFSLIFCQSLHMRMKFRLTKFSHYDVHCKYVQNLLF